MKYFKCTIVFVCACLLLACSVQKKISRSAQTHVLSDSSLMSAHVGISIFDTETNKYLYNYQGDKYFVPASNTKIPTCYAAMKFLGDSLVGFRYETTADALFIEPSADPTFLHPDFKSQPVYNFLKRFNGKIILNTTLWRDQAWGTGWSWNDYSENYMAERSPMPVYGNVVRFSNSLKGLVVTPRFFHKNIMRDSTQDWNLFPTSVRRDIANNNFFVEGKSTRPNVVSAPFYTHNGEIIFKLLEDTLHTSIHNDAMYSTGRNNNTNDFHSQPTDSLLKPMMHRSDNFFAEQTLLMVSNELLGVMNDAKIIDTILKTAFKDLPQKPRWADGSGLSRYNLFTPQSFVAILNKMKNEFGLVRMKEIFPTGGEGTLSSYYKKDSSFLFAKTGTLSGVVALSGFLYTSKNKLLLFSVLVNNHQASATGVRRAVERFLQGVRENY